MRTGLIKKIVACFLSTCITAGVVLPQSVTIGNAAIGQGIYANIYDVYYATNRDVNVNALQSTEMVQTDFSNCWSVEDTAEGKVFTRTGTGEYKAPNSAGKGTSLLYFCEQQYEEFDLTLEYATNTTKSRKWMSVGFGADAPGKSFLDDDGYMVNIEGDGKISYFYADGTTTNTSTYISADANTTYTDALANNINQWHTVNLTVGDGKMQISYDDGTVYTQEITDYAGYIYLSCFTDGMQFRNIKITSGDNNDIYDVYYATNRDVNVNLLTSAEMVQTDFVNCWSVEDTAEGQVFTRTGTGVYKAPNSAGKGTSLLYFCEQQYDEFDLTLEYATNTTKSRKWVSIGFGADEPGKSFLDDDGYMVNIEGDGKISYFYPDGTTTNTSTYISADANTTYADALANNINQWHTVNLTVSGDKMKISYDDGTVYTQEITDYAGYIYLSCFTDGMQFRNIKITADVAIEGSYITSMDVLENVTVEQGTTVDELPLPTAVNVELIDKSQCLLPITWDTSVYQGSTLGTYAIEGKLDVTGTIVPENDPNQKVQMLITVADYNTQAVKEYNFISDAQIDSNFQSYYVGKDNKVTADSDIKEAAASNLWTITERYGIMRSGTGDYSPSTSKNLAGALLYFKEQYTDFEIEFDYDFHGVTKGWKWVGVGVGAKEYGKTGYHEDGGTLALLEQEGHIRTFTNNKGQLLTTDPFDGYRETLSTELHHLKIAVHKGTLFVYVDDYKVVSTTLSDYTGGYVYLYGYTKDLEICNLKISRIQTAKLEQEIPYKSVQKGTTVAKIGLPDTLKVKIEGATVDCPVAWSSEEYTLDKEGTYGFVATPNGKNSHVWLQDNSKGLYASVTVGNSDEEVTQKFALNAVEELESYFTTYYSETLVELNEDGALKPTYAGNTWKTEENTLIRSGSGNYQGGSKGTFGVSALYYKDSMKNFEIEFDYHHGTKGWNWVSVMFGQKEIGQTYYDTGYLACIEREGKVNFVGSTGNESMNFRDAYSYSQVLEGYEDKYKAGEWFHYRLVVTNGIARLYINDELRSCELADDYTGGYVALSINSRNTMIKNLSITNYDAKVITVASVEHVADQNIDKTKGDVLSLSKELWITDTNGYQYRMQVDWVNKEYRSGKLGTYQFVGTPILPSEKVVNPTGVTATATVRVVKVDYNTRNTIKYYFDTEHDLQDFTNYYTAYANEADLTESDWNQYWELANGQLQRKWDDFKEVLEGVSTMHRKISRLTYNEPLTGNYQIDVDYRQDSSSKWWAMICIGTSDKTQFMDKHLGEKKYEQNPLGGTAIYLEREGYVNFWGSPAYTNDNGVRYRITEMKDKLAGYNHKEMHHMKITVIDGVVRVYIDDYEATIATRIPEEALGGYVSLMTNSNAAVFDNFAITKLSDDAVDPYVKTSADAKDLEVRYVCADNDVKDKNSIGTDVATSYVLPIVSILSLCGMIVIAVLVLKKKKEAKR